HDLMYRSSGHYILIGDRLEPAHGRDAPHDTGGRITMHAVAITGTGVFTPEHVITNAELVASYNAYATQWNDAHRAEIESGAAKEMPMSSEEFIVKASGIERRYVMDKAGVLDPDRMRPSLPERSPDDLSIMAEIAVAAA